MCRVWVFAEVLPSLQEVLKGRKAMVIPSLKEALERSAEPSEPSGAAEDASQRTSDAPRAEGPSAAAELRRGVCYDDLDDTPSAAVDAAPSDAAVDGAPEPAVSSASTPRAGDAEVDQGRLAVALRRVTKDSERRVRAAKAFVFGWAVNEDEIREWLGPAGDIKGLRLNRDKATTKALGYGHVQFANPEAASAAVQQCDKIELHGRVMRVAPISSEKFQFELPSDIKDRASTGLDRGLAYEGKNISTIKDAWQKRHPGTKLNTTKWGFKNFSTALKTLEGVVLEHHLEKTLTYLAFFQDSEKHQEFLQAKARKGPADRAPTVGEAKRAQAEADLVPKKENGSAQVKDQEASMSSRSGRTPRKSGVLERWLESARKAPGLEDASLERLYVQSEALAWLCDLLPTYRALLIGDAWCRLQLQEWDGRERQRQLQQLDATKSALSAAQVEVQRLASQRDQQMQKLQECLAERDALQEQMPRCERLPEEFDKETSPASDAKPASFFTAIKLERDPTVPAEESARARRNGL
eukprot:g8524.t1